MGALALLCLSVPGAAEVAAQQPPPPEELITTFVEAIGGRSAHTTPSSVRRTGTVSLPAVGLQGSFEVLQIAPDRMLTHVSLPGVGEVLTGFDGEVGWRVDPLTGPAIMQGAELAQARDRAHLLAAVRDTSLVAGMETIGLDESQGQPCWRVRLEWASGRESFDCYSRETGLLLVTEETQASPMGELPVTTLFSDYRSFQGMFVPTRLVQTAMGQTQEMRVDELEIDTVEPSAVDPPPEVRTLLETAPGR